MEQLLVNTLLVITRSTFLLCFYGLRTARLLSFSRAGGCGVVSADRVHMIHFNTGKIPTQLVHTQLGGRPEGVRMSGRAREGAGVRVGEWVSG